MLIAIGTILLLIPGAGTRKLSFMEAFFTSTSASAVTGLSLFPISTDLTLWGQLILLLLIQVGGVGLDRCCSYDIPPDRPPANAWGEIGCHQLVGVGSP